MVEKPQLHQVKSSFISPSRLLTIAPSYMEFEGPLNDVHFSKEDIEAFRFGVSLFQFYTIPISRTYSIEIKNSEGNILLIRMHCFFWIGIKDIQSRFIRIHNQIHEAYFNDMAVHYVKLLRTGLSFELSGVFLTPEGVYLKKNKPVIPWKRIGLHSYFHSCTLYDLTDPGYCRAFDYWHDWNASLLRTVVDYTIRIQPSYKRQHDSD